MIDQLRQIAEGGTIVIYLAAIYLLGKLVVFLGNKILKHNEDLIKQKDIEIEKLNKKLEYCQQERLEMQIDFSERQLESEKSMIKIYDILRKTTGAPGSS